MPPAPQPRVRSREIEPADRAAVEALLARGFPERPAAYWARALDRLATRRVPDGCPRFGYLLAADDAVVGVILAIASTLTHEGSPYMRCNVSSWYVEPAFRAYAAFLVRKALSRPDVTYLNISPATDTLAAAEAQGYSRYATGQVFAVPALVLRGGGAVRPIAATDDAATPRDALLADHAALGCLSLICTQGGREYPFVFVRRRIAGGRVAAAQLAYCEDEGDLVRCAGAVGRFLLRQGIVCVIVDANAPLAGLPGRYYADKAPKFFFGPVRPRLGDLAYTELVLFGP